MIWAGSTISTKPTYNWWVQTWVWACPLGSENVQHLSSCWYIQTQINLCNEAEKKKKKTKPHLYCFIMQPCYMSKLLFSVQHVLYNYNYNSSYNYWLIESSNFFKKKYLQNIYFFVEYLKNNLTTLNAIIEGSNVYATLTRFALYQHRWKDNNILECSSFNHEVLHLRKKEKKIECILLQTQSDP